MNKSKIVILGAGYGGIITNKTLEKLLKSGEADVTLINKHEYHYITTQLHKTGVGTAADRQIAMSIPELIDPSKTHFLKATVSNVDTTKQEVHLETLAPTAQVALQQAPVCAKNIVATLRGQSLKAFEYHHKGSVASIGLSAGVGKVGTVRLSGLIGAFMKLVIEARYLFNLGGPSLIIKQHFGVNRKPLKVTVKQ
jgi:NADH dehydrogenase FAD-containing subunit